MPAAPRLKPVTADGQPRTMPLLKMIRAGDGWHLLDYADAQSPTRRKKPDGVAYLELAIIISPPDQPLQLYPPTSEQLGSCRIERIKRTPFTITHDRALAGSRAVYFGRWVSTKKIPGPWSLGEMMTIAAVMSPV